MLRKTLPVAALVLLLAVGAGARFFFRESRDVTTDSSQAYEAYQQGLAEHRRYRWVNAVQHFEQAITADSTFAMAYLQLSRTAYNLNQRELAKSCVEKAYALRGDLTEIEQLQIDRSYAALQKNKQEVESLYEALVEKYPEHPYTCMARAEKAKSAGDLEEAARCYGKILEVDPERVDIHNLLGYLHLQSGNYEEAITSLQRYAFFAPDLANPHDSLAEAYFHTGYYEKSIEHYLESLDIDPTFANSAAMLSRVLSTTGQSEAARSVLDKTQTLFEERNWEYWLAWERFMIEFRAQRWDQALEKIDAAIAVLESDSYEEQKEHNRTSLLFQRAVVQIELGDIEAAKEAALEVRDRAEKELAEVEGSPRWKESYELHAAYMMSRIARAEGHPSEGIAVLQEAVGKSEWSPHELAGFRYELARAHYEAGEYDEAVAAGKKLLAAIPTAPRMNLLLGEALVKAERPQEAIPYLTTYANVMRSADPDHPEVAKARKLLKQLAPTS